VISSEARLDRSCSIVREFEPRIPLIRGSVGAAEAALFNLGFNGMLGQIERSYPAARK
jgi:hypothetical protein